MTNLDLLYGDNGLQQDNPERGLKAFTNARVSIGNSGGSQRLADVLSFQMDHAKAKDAIFASLDTNKLATTLKEHSVPVFLLTTKVANREQYLKRPDYGKILSEASSAYLRQKAEVFDIVIVITDGLSAEAVNKQAIPTITSTIPLVNSNLRIAACVVEEGRVAIADEIGQLLGAEMSIILIGERPGLSSPESMGIYTTYNPQVGTTDERRNCISNVHQNGISVSYAAIMLAYLINISLEKKMSGTAIKLAFHSQELHRLK